MLVMRHAVTKLPKKSVRELTLLRPRAHLQPLMLLGKFFNIIIERGWPLRVDIRVSVSIV